MQSTVDCANKVPTGSTEIWVTTLHLLPNFKQQTQWGPSANQTTCGGSGHSKPTVKLSTGDKQGPNKDRKRTLSAKVRVAQPTAKLSTVDKWGPRTNVNGGENKYLPNLTITN